MRTRNKTLLSCAAVAGLLTAVDAGATGYTTSCSSISYSFTVIAGPCLVQDPNNPVCSTTGDYTGIRYQVSGSAADHVYALVTANNVVVGGPGVQVFGPGQGCPSTDLGVGSQHEKCVKVNPQGSTRRFWVVAAGKKTPIQTTVAAKKGSCFKSYAIQGLGLDTNAFAAVTPNETVAFKECKVEFVKDPISGAVSSAALTADSPESCSLYESSVEEMSVSVPGAGNVGVPRFGDGYVSSGTNSCITRILGGRVYTWGSPCPD